MIGRWWNADSGSVCTSFSFATSLSYHILALYYLAFFETQPMKILTWIKIHYWIVSWWEDVFLWCWRNSVSYSHHAGLASGTPDSVKDVVEGDDVVLQCRFSPALKDSSATLYWIRWLTSFELCLNSYSDTSVCPSHNLVILRNINDQHDNVAIGETPFSTGYT